MADSPTDDELDLFEARKAVTAAKNSRILTTSVVDHANRASAGISTIVSANGFLERFRSVYQGGTP